MNSTKNWIFWLVLFAISCWLIYLLRPVLLPFAGGIVIGYLLDPLASKLEKWGVSRTMATVLVMCLVIIIMVPVIILIVNLLNEQIGVFLNVIPQYVAALVKKTAPLLQKLKEYFPSMDTAQLEEDIRSNMSDNLKLAGGIVKSIVSGGMALVNLISLLVITPVVAFYMLRDWKKFIKKVNDLLPRKSKHSIIVQAKEIDRTLAGFIRGQFSVCIILGTFYAISLHLAGLDLGLMIGFIAGVISFIPYVGTITGFVMSLILAFVQFSTMEPVLVVIGIFAVGQFIEGNFLTPKLVGDSVGLHPVWIMFALLAGGVLLGFLGMLVAVPVAAIIGVLTRHAIDNYKKSHLYLED